MSRYVVFDVETPNCKNNRMSAIGISIVGKRSIITRYASASLASCFYDIILLR